MQKNATGILFPELEAERVSFKPVPGIDVDVDRFSVLRPTWNLKRTARFLSIRKWRLVDKRGGIDAVKRAKQDHDEKFASVIAGELSNAIRLFLGSAGFWITAPPQGASCKWGDWHLASRASNYRRHESRCGVPTNIRSQAAERGKPSEEFQPPRIG